MWKWIFDERKGMLNNFLALLGIQGPDWFGQTATAIPAFTIMGFWGAGFMIIIYLGALQSIPKEIEESCELDGAGPLRRLFRITLPMISPVIMYQVVRGIIGSFQVFMTAYVISGGHDGVSLGGPNDAYLFYVLNLYKQAFINLRMGYASALAWFLFGIIFLFTLFIFKSSPLWTFYRSGERD
jgi:multiple sugar transport system permease protein